VKIAKERQISLTYRIKKGVQMYIFTKQKKKKKTYGYQGIRGKDELGDLD